MSTAHAIPAAEAESGPLILTRDGAVAVLTMNRPKARNALAECLLDALAEAFAEISADADIKAVVLAGAPPAFCAGHDLREMTEARSREDRGRAYFETIFAKCSAVMQAIVACPKPVIAAVDGIATAAGCQLVATCDLAVTGDASRFATPGVNIGLFCSTPMVALSRNLSRKAAMEMLLTGEMVSAADAAAIGLINRVAPAAALMQDTVALAEKIAAKPRATLKIGKEAFYRQIELPLEEAYGYASCVMVDNMLHAEAEEGIGAFLDKRVPRWPDGE